METAEQAAADGLWHRRGCPEVGNAPGTIVSDPITGELRGSRLERFIAVGTEGRFEITACCACGERHYRRIGNA